MNKSDIGLCAFIEDNNKLYNDAINKVVWSYTAIIFLMVFAVLILFYYVNNSVPNNDNKKINKMNEKMNKNQTQNVYDNTSYDTSNDSDSDTGNSDILPPIPKYIQQKHVGFSQRHDNRRGW
jgi:ABC-type multidrug transport system fused ATPase/permease subunit